MEEISRIAVAGAGTMGVGIAQVSCLGGYETRLYDPDPDALERGAEQLRTYLDKGVKHERWSREQADEAAERLRLTGELEQLAEAELVIEAAPEDMEVKRQLLRELCEAADEQPILATNTSSMPVTALAAAAERPERVCGMHFFNPPALVELVEVVAGEQTAEDVLVTAEQVAEQMGCSPLRVRDRPGFVANRINRPFNLEALRLAGEGFASFEQIDTICRRGAGFPMGPFELMDLVGIDVSFQVARSFYEQSFHEPRWRPHPMQERLAEGGLHGRKTGRGFYSYGDGAYRERDPEPPQPGGGEGQPVVVEGSGPIGTDLRGLAEQAGYEVFSDEAQLSEPAVMLVDASRVEDRDEFEATPLHAQEPVSVSSDLIAVAPSATAVLLSASCLADLDPGHSATGFYLLPPVEPGCAVELTRTTVTTDAAADSAERFFSNLGLHCVWVGDEPGLALGRIVCQLINEAAFALMDGTATAEEIDTAMRLGLHHPQGPLEWADQIGIDHVLGVLDALWRETHEERYRACPGLRRMVSQGRTGAYRGHGFYDYAPA